jgi:hypothetical protein
MGGGNSHDRNGNSGQVRVYHFAGISRLYPNYRDDHSPGNDHGAGDVEEGKLSARLFLKIVHDLLTAYQRRYLPNDSVARVVTAIERELQKPNFCPECGGRIEEKI